MLDPICQNLDRLDSACRQVLNVIFSDCPAGYLHTVAVEIPLMGERTPAEEVFRSGVIRWGEDQSHMNYTFTGLDQFAIVHVDSPEWQAVVPTLDFNVGVFFYGVLGRKIPWPEDNGRIIRQATTLGLSYDEFSYLIAILGEDLLQHTDLRFVDVTAEMQVSSYYKV